MLDHHQFLVKEHVGLFKLTNAYDILDPQDGHKIGLAQEVTPGWVHLLGMLVNRQMLPTRVDLIANPDEHGQGTVIASIKRGFTLLRAKVQVLAGDGSQIGYFKSKILSFGGGFYLYDPRDQQIAEVKGDWKGWNFRLIGTGGVEMGTITKQWAGIGKEFFTSADTYIISINEKLAASREAKTLLLAAGIAIDTIYKEH